MTRSMQQLADSYVRVGARDLESAGFFASIYKNFVAPCQGSAEKIQNTDMARQPKMLLYSPGSSGSLACAALLSVVILAP